MFSILQQTYSQWQYVFWILAVTYGIGCLTFLIFGSGELQSWNSPASVKAQVDIELNKEQTEPLKNGTQNGS